MRPLYYRQQALYASQSRQSKSPTRARRRSRRPKSSCSPSSWPRRSACSWSCRATPAAARRSAGAYRSNIFYFSAVVTLPRSYRFGKCLAASSGPQSGLGSHPRRYSERAAELAKGASGGDFGQFLLSVWAAHWIGAWRGVRGWINSRELFALRIAGTAIGASAAWTLGRAYDRVVTPESLVTTGPYRFVRHPIYTGYLLLFAGGLASLGSPLAVAVLLLSAWRFYKPRMASEDKILEEQFGDAWRNYAAATPSRLLPFVV